MNIKLLKLTASAFLVYAMVGQSLFFEIPGLSPMLTLACYFFMFLYLIEHKNTVSLRDGITPEIVCHLLFLVSIVIGGLLVASNTREVMGASSRFAQNLFLGVAFLFICAHDKNCTHIHQTLILIACIVVFDLVFAGQEIRNSGRFSISEDMNSNSVALTLLTGVYCLLREMIGSGKIKKALYLALIFFMGYGIFMTGSRKAFIAMGMLLGLWFLLYYVPAVFRKNAVLPLLGLMLCIGVLCGVVAIFWADLSEMTMFQRLFHMSDELEGGSRVSMYGEAVNFFLQSPIFGIGINHFQFHSIYGYYSHSTYAEVISCTGLVGTFCYLSAFILIGVNAVKAYFVYGRRKDWQRQAVATLTLIFLLVNTFLAVGVIFFYSVSGSLLIALMASENNRLLPYNRR